MAKWQGRRRSKKSMNFKPSSKFIKSAMEDYLSAGGKITKLEPNRDYATIIQIKGQFSEADEFLTET